MISVKFLRSERVMCIKSRERETHIDHKGSSYPSE
jgi:hypothetical protein